MTKIKASDVNKLRQMTGVGMMDCKKALVETDGDFDKAIEHLRKKGQKLAGKRADKDANEGFVVAKISPCHKFATILMLNCETDFVAKNQEFVDFANNIADYALQNKINTVEEILNATLNGSKVAEQITDFVGKVGEKIEISKLFFMEAPYCAAYNHNGNRVAAIAAFNKADVNNIEEIGKNICMQIAAMKPVAVDKDDVSKEIVERELEIGKEQAKQEGKPENIIEKIAQGKLQKFYADNTLLNQEFIKEAKQSVKAYLMQANKDLTVTAFKRLELGA